MVYAVEPPVLFAFSTALGLAFMIIVAGDVGTKVHRPAEKLLAD